MMNAERRLLNDGGLLSLRFFIIHHSSFQRLLFLLPLLASSKRVPYPLHLRLTGLRLDH